VSAPSDVEQVAESARGWRVLAPLRFRDFRLLIAAVAIFIFAEGMWTVVMALQVIALADDPAALSLVATCLAGGMLAFILVGGIVADRLPQRVIIIAVEAVNLVAVAAVAVLGMLGELRLWHMAVASAVLGAGAAFFFPAYSAYLPRILPPQHLLAANGIEGMVRPTLGQAMGPASAGMLVGATFPAWGSAAVAVLFAVGLVLLVAIRPKRAENAERAENAGLLVAGAPRDRPHPLADLRDGFVFVLRTRWLLWTLLFASVWVLLAMGPMEVLLPFIARERFVHGGQSYGFLLAAYGLGSALGALAVSTRPLPRRYLTLMMMLWGLGSLPLAVVGVTPSFPVMAIALFVVGVAGGAGMVLWGTLLQRRVPAHMLGRVSSLDFFVSLSFMPVSMALAGPLSKVVAVDVIFAVAGVGPIVLAVIALAAARMPVDEIAHPLN
jgi:DHA3 family tetracycline resistance protein-like MFS transporter